MKKFVLLISLMLIVGLSFLIPVEQQKTVLINSSFFNVYQQLINGNNWINWRKDFKRHNNSSASIVVKKRSNGYELLLGSIIVDVTPVNGYSFEVKEDSANKSENYSYTIFPDKLPNVTTFTITRKRSIWHAAIDGINGGLLAETHANDLKKYMESTALYYGYEIVRSKVIDTEIVVLRQSCPAKSKFTVAAKELATLYSYISSKGLKQTQPYIAQFISKNNDSVQVNIGLPVDKKTAAVQPLALMQMPAAGTLYIVYYQGKFNERSNAYDAVEKYFRDKQLTKLMPPFETYINNKIPKSDTSKVDIQINFPSF